MNNASIAIAEASYIEQLILKFKGLAEAVATQQTAIAGYQLEMATLQVTVENAVTQVKAYVTQAEAAASRAENIVGDDSLTELKKTLDSLTSLLASSSEDAASAAKSAASAEASAKAASTVYDNVQAFSTSISSEVATASAAAAQATEAASVVGESVSSAAASAAAAAESAEKAAEALAGMSSNTEEIEKLAEATEQALAKAEEALAAAVASSGTRVSMVYMGSVDTEEDLPEGADASTVWYVSGMERVYIQDDGSWSAMENKSTGGVLRFEQGVDDSSSEELSALAGALVNGTVCYELNDDGDASPTYVVSDGAFVKVARVLNAEELSELTANTFVTQEDASDTYVTKAEWQQDIVLDNDPSLIFEESLAGS